MERTKIFSDDKLEILKFNCDVLNIMASGISGSVDIAQLIGDDTLLLKGIDNTIKYLQDMKRVIKAEY